MLLAAVLGLTAAGPARADIPPAAPFQKHANSVHRVETAEAFPDHVFVVYKHNLLMRSEGQNSLIRAEFAELTPDRPVVIRSQYPGDTSLYIVPKAAATSFPTALDLGTAVEAGRVPGVVRRTFGFREVVPSWGSNEVVVTHRVQRAGDGNGLVLVRTGWNPL